MPIKRFYYLDIAKVLNTTIDRIDTIISVDNNKKIRKNMQGYNHRLINT